MSKTYNTPKLVAQGAVVDLTQGGDIGKNDPDRVTALAASAGAGFGL
jgi:hypothetical protein